MKTAHAEDQWFEFAPIHLEWLNPIQGLDVGDYVKKMVATSKELDAKALAFCVDTAGRTMYDSRFGPKDSHIGKHDLIRELIDETHANGLKFIGAFYGSQGNSYLSEQEHPDWCVLDKDGKRRSWFAFSQLCPNSPFGDYYAQWIGEFLTKYEADGIYVEGIYIPNGYCHCKYCRNLFSKLYARDLPQTVSPDDAEYHAYRVDSVARVAAEISKTVRQTRPEAVFYWTSYFPGNCDIRSIASCADVVVMERQWGYGGGMVREAPLVETGLHTRIAAARSGRPLSETHHPHKQVDCDYSPRSPSHVKLTFWETVANGSTVQSHVQNYFDTERSRFEDLAGCFRNLNAVRPSLVGARRIAFAGIVDGIVKKGAPISPELKGIHLALTESHVLYDIIAHETLERAEQLFPACRLLFLPEARITGTELEGLRDYAAKGGVVVISGVNAFSPELLELAGVRMEGGGVLKSPSPFGQWYFRFASDGTLRSFRGDIVQVATDPDVEVVANVHRFDYTRMHSHHQVIGWYPDTVICPLLTSRAIGEGRIVYIAGGAGQSFFDYGHADILLMLMRAVAYSSAPMPVSVEAPGSVEVAAYANESTKELVVFLLNHTTNQFGKSEVLRYCVPVGGVRVRIAPEFRAGPVRSINGGAFTTAASDDGAKIVELKTLTEYEILVIECQSLQADGRIGAKTSGMRN